MISDKVSVPISKIETNAGFNADSRGYAVLHGPGKGGYGNHANGGGGGGGGRIAVWVNVPELIRNQFAAGIPTKVRQATEHRAYNGSISVANGLGWKNPDDPDGAYPGTAFFSSTPEDLLSRFDNNRCEGNE